MLYKSNQPVLPKKVKIQPNHDETAEWKVYYVVGLTNEPTPRYKLSDKPSGLMHRVCYAAPKGVIVITSGERIKPVF